MSWDTAELRSSRDITPEVKQFQFRLDNDEWDFKPGQHTHIRFEQDGDEVVRPYTPITLPGGDMFCLAIKRYDDGTASVWMHDRELGDEVEVEEPEGNLYIRDYSTDAVFISTGTGATPMFAMMKDFIENGSGDAWYFHGEKTREHLILQETLDQLEAEHPGLQVVYSLSDEEWSGPEGHVQDHLETYLDSFEDKHFYICGVPAAVVDTQEVLENNGVSSERIFTEGWESDAV